MSADPQGQPKEQSPLDERLNHWITPSPLNPTVGLILALFMIPRGGMQGLIIIC